MTQEKKLIDFELLAHYDDKIKTHILNKTTFSNSEPLLENIGGILASAHPNGFDNVAIVDLLNELLYPYKSPVVSTVTLKPAAGVYEKGQPIRIESVSTTVTKKSLNIIDISLFENGIKKQSNLEGITNGNKTITFDIGTTYDGTSNISYQISVKDTSGTIVTSNKATYTFVDPYYYGVISPNAILDTAYILSNGVKKVKVKGNHSYTYTTDNECAFIAYPASYGELSSIIDANNFKQTWHLATLNINDVSYYVYKNEAATATDFKYTFNY